MVDVSASVNLPFHHKVQKFSSGTGSPGWSRKKGRKTVVLVVVDRGRFVKWLWWFVATLFGNHGMDFSWAEYPSCHQTNSVKARKQIQ